jgi:hypothetical protein
MRLKVGYSLSFCVTQILAGLVPEDEVYLIYAGTKARNDTEFEQVVEHGVQFYWKDQPEEARALCWRLWREGRIIQPRLRREPIRSLVDRQYWSDTLYAHLQQPPEKFSYW